MKKNIQKFTVTTKIEFAFPKYLCQDTLSQNLTRLFNRDINIRKIKLQFVTENKKKKYKNDILKVNKSNIIWIILKGEGESSRGVFLPP